MATATQFDSYFFGTGLVDDAKKGVAIAVAHTHAADLKVEGYASNADEQPTQDNRPKLTLRRTSTPTEAADKEPKTLMSEPDEFK